jgi:hypothetical protein
MTTMTLSNQHMQMPSMFLAASLAPSHSAMSVFDSAFAVSVDACVGVYAFAAAQALAMAIGADAPAHVSNGWVTPCTPAVASKRTDLASVVSPIDTKETTRRTAIKPANKPVNTWLLRPLGVQGTPPG